MIITGSIVGVLLPDSSIFIRACGARDLIENTNESCARRCASVRVMSTFCWMWIFGCVQYGSVHVCGCVSVINPW